MTSVTNIVYYPIGLTLFFLEGWLLSFILPFHAKLHASELKSNRQIPLDGLRGLLALGVFFTHVLSYYYYHLSNRWEFPPCNWGAQLAIAPVCIFFYITGYLFWSKLRKASLAPTARFWLSRVARLMPVYLFACGVAFVYAALLSKFTVRVPARDLAGQVTSWVANARLMDLNNVSDSHLWLTQAWTLRLEWMFYFSLPFLRWFGRGLQKTLLLLILIGLLSGLGQIAERIAGQHSLTSFALTYSHFFLHSFSLGILVAFLPPERFSRFAKGRLATIVSLVLLCAVLLIAPPRYGVLETCLLSLPFTCICLGNTWWGLLSSRGMRFLGRISYSFYLLHLVSFTIVMELARKHGLLVDIRPPAYWALSCGIGSVIIVICAFSYQWLEHPFLHIGQTRNAFAVTEQAPSQFVVGRLELPTAQNPEIR